MVVDLQEEELTFLQKEETVNEELSGNSALRRARKGDGSHPSSRSFPKHAWLLETDMEWLSYFFCN